MRTCSSPLAAEEYYFNKAVMSRFVTAPFDDLNRDFMHIRRVSDIYEWGNRVLLPGLFWGAPPCNESEITAGRDSSQLIKRYYAKLILNYK